MRQLARKTIDNQRGGIMTVLVVVLVGLLVALGVVLTIAYHNDHQASPTPQVLPGAVIGTSPSPTSSPVTGHRQ